MCLGAISRLDAAWTEEGTPLGRLENGTVVTLSFVPEAREGAYLLVELGIPVEILEPAAAAAALALREETR